MTSLTEGSGFRTQWDVQRLAVGCLDRLRKRNKLGKAPSEGAGNQAHEVRR
jgi:hypothetical protein